MARKKSKYVHVRDIMSLYSDSNMIAQFRQDIGFSSTEHKKDVILEPCSETERANMATSGGSSTPSFYMHLAVIHEFRVLTPFMPFEENFLATVNVAPPKSRLIYGASPGPLRLYVVTWVSFPLSGYSVNFMA